MRGGNDANGEEMAQPLFTGMRTIFIRDKQTFDNSLAKRAEPRVLEFRGAEKHVLTLSVSQGS